MVGSLIVILTALVYRFTQLAISYQLSNRVIEVIVAHVEIKQVNSAPMASVLLEYRIRYNISR